MFGVDSSELLIVAILALIFIGPKDLPRVMLQVGRWVGKVRGYTRHFTAGIENAIREAELDEMDRKWREQNERILADHPADASYAEGDWPKRGTIPAELMTGTVTIPAPGAPVDLPNAATDQALHDLPAPPPPPAAAPEPMLPFEVPAAPDDDPRPIDQRPLP